MTPLDVYLKLVPREQHPDDVRPASIERVMVNAVRELSIRHIAQMHQIDQLKRNEIVLTRSLRALARMPGNPFAAASAIDDILAGLE